MQAALDKLNLVQLFLGLELLVSTDIFHQNLRIFQILALQAKSDIKIVLRVKSIIGFRVHI